MNMQPFIVPPETNFDWYKNGHRLQYPEGTELVFSNFTSRKSRLSGIDHSYFFGLQYFIKRYLMYEWTVNFFQQPFEKIAQRYERRVRNALGDKQPKFLHLKELHDLGYLPLRILALPEGSKVPIGVPPMVHHNTNKKFYWLTNYIETILSCTIWGPINSATIAADYRRIFEHYAKLTVGKTDFVDFQGHDFSFRGMFGLEAALMSNAAHNIFFLGSDTTPAIDWLEHYYNANSDNELIGLSVNATEHSVMCAGGSDNELDTITRMLDIYPDGIISIVSDTWDYWGVLTNILPKLKDRIMSRNGKVVIRPDSSPKTPREIICGDLESEKEVERNGSVRFLWDLFGGTGNYLGFKELDPHIGLIYGDSITRELADSICFELMLKKFASINWVAGIGSYTYQYNTRDTLGGAVKGTYVEINGKPRNISKNPKTDSGTKKSAKGLIAVYEKDGSFYKKEEATWDEVNNCAFQEVFVDGQLKRDEHFSNIRKVSLSTV